MVFKGSADVTHLVENDVTISSMPLMKIQEISMIILKNQQSRQPETIHNREVIKIKIETIRSYCLLLKFPIVATDKFVLVDHRRLLFLPTRYDLEASIVLLLSKLLFVPSFTASATLLRITSKEVFSGQILIIAWFYHTFVIH